MSWRLVPLRPPPPTGALIGDRRVWRHIGVVYDTCDSLGQLSVASSLCVRWDWRYTRHVEGPRMVENRPRSALGWISSVIDVVGIPPVDGSIFAGLSTTLPSLSTLLHPSSTIHFTLPSQSTSPSNRYTFPSQSTSPFLNTLHCRGLVKSGTG